MPSGKNHDRITWLCLPWVFIVTIIATRDLLTGFVVASGFLFSGLMFGPDLDIYSLQYKRWGFIKFIWLPYQRYLRHRSIFSHGFIIGTVIRSLYLSSILLVLGLVLGAIALMIFPNQWQWGQITINLYEIIRIYVQEIIALFIGLELGAMSHYLADAIGSWLKSRAKRKTQKRKTKRIPSQRRSKVSNRRKPNRKKKSSQ